MSDDSESPEVDEGLLGLVRRIVEEEVAFRHRRILWTFIPAAVVAAAIIAGLAGVSFYMAQRVSANQHALAVTRAHDRRTDVATVATLRRSDAEARAQLKVIEALNYKLCVRTNDTRGVTLIRLKAIHGGPGALASDLPLYRCIKGVADGTALLTPRQTTAYLALLARGKKPGP